MIGKTTNTKIKHILKEISKAKGETIHIEIINSSRFIFTEHRNFRTFPYVYDLKIYTSPDIFYKYYDLKHMFQTEIKQRIRKSTDYEIDSID